MTIKDFGPLLERLRIRANLNKSALSRLTGVNNTSLATYERGEAFPNQETLEKLAKVLPIPLEECKALCTEYQAEIRRRSKENKAEKNRKVREREWGQPRPAPLAADELDAIAWEAGRRGVSYGKLAATLTEASRKDIIREFRAWRRKPAQERENTSGRAYVSTVTRYKW